MPIYEMSSNERDCYDWSYRLQSVKVASVQPLNIHYVLLWCIQVLGKLITPLAALICQQLALTFVMVISFWKLRWSQKEVAQKIILF